MIGLPFLTCKIQVIRIPKSRLTYFQYLSQQRLNLGISTPNEIDPTFDNENDYMFIDEGYWMQFCLSDESRSTSSVDDYQYFSGYEGSEGEFSESETDYWTDYTVEYDTECSSTVSDEGFSDTLLYTLKMGYPIFTIKNNPKNYLF